MEIKEDHPSNNVRKNELKIYSEYNNLDLLHYLYYCGRFSRRYYDYIEFNDFAPCMSIQLLHNNERQDAHQQNHEIMTVQVNTAELNITYPWDIINYISTVSPYCNYCSDINKLKKYRFHIKEHKENEKNLSQRSEFCISVNNMQNLKQGPENKSNVFYYTKKQFLCNGKPKRIERLNSRETCLLSNGIQGNSFDTGFERQGIDFRISLCKYSLPNLFYTLIQMCNSCIQLAPDAVSVNIFSRSVGYWYFQNISQGYLLKLILRNVHISTLSVMMQLYFILITHVHPNLTIQINYKRTPELLTIHESLLINTFSFKSVQWCEDHRVVLKTTMLHFPNAYKEERYPLKLLYAIPYANTAISQIESLIQAVDYEEQTQSEHADSIEDEVENNIEDEDEDNIEDEDEDNIEDEDEGNIEDEDEDNIEDIDKNNMILRLSSTEYENNMLPLESENETKANILPLPAPYKKYSDIFRWDDIENFTEASWTRSIQKLSALNKDAELKKTNIKLLNILFSCGVSNFSFMQNKLWVTELRQKFDALKMYINLHDVFDSHMINESMFEETSVNLYEKYCKPILNQKFVVITLHNLGKSLGNILFNMN